MSEVRPPTSFDWPIYADATFAGLSLLIPIPLLDLAFEWYFRRRTVSTIARRRGRQLDPAVTAEINRGEGCLGGCLWWPLKLVVLLLKRLSRKILYFLTVKEATDQLSQYWHRAFLLDYMLALGHLDSLATAEPGRAALDETLGAPDTSPMVQLAQQLARNTHHVLRSLRGARRGREDEEIEAKKSLMARTWDDFNGYLGELALTYDRAYEAAVAAREAALQAATAAASAGEPPQA